MTSLFVNYYLLKAIGNVQKNTVECR